MSVTRRTLLASLGLTLPVAAAEAATRRGKKTAAAKHASHGHASHASHITRTARSRRPVPPTQS